MLKCDGICYLPMQAEALDLDVSVQETLERAATDAQLNDIKALLGRMMFTGKSVHKKVCFLSAASIPDAIDVMRGALCSWYVYLRDVLGF
jgi:hypothetical protein